MIKSGFNRPNINLKSTYDSNQPISNIKNGTIGPGKIITQLSEQANISSNKTEEIELNPHIKKQNDVSLGLNAINNFANDLQKIADSSKFNKINFDVNKSNTYNTSSQEISNIYYELEHTFYYVTANGLSNYEIKGNSFVERSKSIMKNVYCEGLKNSELLKGKTPEEIDSILEQIMEMDKDNNFSILQSVPLVTSGKVSVTIPNSDIYKYNGDYITFFNKDGLKVKAPLAVLGYKNNEKDISLTKLDLDNRGESYIQQVGYYYRDMIHEIDGYPQYYKDYSIKKLNGITLCYLKDEKKVNGYYDDSSNSIVMNMLTNVESNGEYAITFTYNTFNHEVAHAFDFNKPVNKDSAMGTFNKHVCNIDSLLMISNVATSLEWAKVFSQVKKSDENGLMLGSYAYTSPEECFAEAVSAYYYDWSDDEVESAIALKNIKIDYAGYTNLYDYIDDLVNGRRLIND